MPFISTVKSMFMSDPRLDRKFLSNLSTAMVFSEKDEARKVMATMDDRNQGITTKMDARPILDFLPDDMIEQIAKTADRDGVHIPRSLRPLEKFMAVNPQDVVVLDAEEFSAYAAARLDKEAHIAPR